jgi:uncharacterized protein (TIGR03067 family)
MSRCWRLRTIGGLSLALALALASPGLARADDFDRMQGAWRATYAAVGDKVANKNQLKGIGVVVDGTKFTLNEGAVSESAHLHLDPEATPRVVEFRQGKEKETKLLYHGIYQFEEDKLKICWGPAGAPRPGRFETDKKNDRRLFILEKK